MATVTGAGTALTLLDLSRRMDPNGKIAKIAEVIAETNEVIEDMLWLEGNLQTGHKTTIRTGYPNGTWRKFNYGVQAEKGTTQQVTDACGMLELYSEMDAGLAQLGGIPETRSSEDKAGIIGLTETLASTLFYGNTDTDPEKFMGFSPRFDTPSATVTNVGYNMLDGGAVDAQTDTTSIWLVGWGDQTCFGIYPKGSQAGLNARDLGEHTKTLADGSMLQVFRTHFKWDAGLCVRDWRFVVRIVNVDTSVLVADPTGGTVNLLRLMIKATERLPSMALCKPVFYVNRTVRTMLRLQQLEAAKYGLTFETVAGKPVTMFQGIPVRRCDAIVNTETAVLDSAGTFGTP